MSEKRILKRDGSTAVIKDGRFVDNIGGAGVTAPTANPANTARPSAGDGPTTSSVEQARTAMIETAVREFYRSEEAEEFAGMWDGPGSNWAGLCEAVNGAFVEYLAERGMSAELTDWVGNGNGTPDGAPHTVAVVHGQVVDFAYRQFDEDADLPVVQPVKRWREGWRESGTYTVDTNHGPVDLDTRDGQIGPEMREAYLHGQCFALAVAWAERHGSHVAVMVADNDDIPWGTDYRDENHTLDMDHDWFDVVHVTAVHWADEELAVDIDGDRDLESWREEIADIHGGTMVRMSPEDLRAVLAHTGRALPQDYAAGRQVSYLVDAALRDG